MAFDSATAPAVAPPRFLLVGSLLTVYVVWGSTYFAIKVALESFPPFLMAGVRFAIAGSAMLAVLRARGAPLPSAIQWRAALPVGVLLLTFGNGGVVFAEMSVTSAVASMMVASVPLWAALFAGAFGRWPTVREWLGLAVGLVGVVVLNSGGELRASPWGAAALVLAAASWAFGSIWSKRLPMPSGGMSGAVQMLGGGAALFVLSALTHEHLPRAVTLRSCLAVGYLILFGSLLAFSAYTYLLRCARPALATSYAYVNPLVAVGLGVFWGGEHLSVTGFAALGLILTGVALMAIRRS